MFYSFRDDLLRLCYKKNMLCGHKCLSKTYLQIYRSLDHCQDYVVVTVTDDVALEDDATKEYIEVKFLIKNVNGDWPTSTNRILMNR
jgi:hypothetical protein